MSHYADRILAQSSLVGYWPMTNKAGTGNNTLASGIADVSGAALHGTPASVTFGLGGIPAGGTATEFNGLASIDLGDPTALELVAPFTISMWVYPTAAQSYPAMFAKTGSFSESAADYVLYCDSNSLRPTWSMGGTAQVVKHATAMTLNAWHHVAVTRSSNTHTVYLDGVGQSGTSSGVPTYGTNKTLVGVWQLPSTGAFVGRIQELAVFSTALSAATLLADYNAGRVAKSFARRGMTGGIRG